MSLVSTLQHLIASHTYIIEIISVNMLCAVIAWSSLVSVSHWLRLLSADNDSRIVCLDWLGLNMLVCTQESAAKQFLKGCVVNKASDRFHDRLYPAPRHTGLGYMD